MRQNAMLPAGVVGGLPDVYRLWRLCRKHNTLWWDGGIAQQPHFLMLEFEVIDQAHEAIESYQKSVFDILSIQG